MIEKKVVAILADVRINSIHGRESYSFAIYFALENKCLAQPPLLIPSSYMQYPVHTGVTVSAPGDKAKIIGTVIPNSKPQGGARRYSTVLGTGTIVPDENFSIDSDWPIAFIQKVFGSLSKIDTDS